VDSYEVTFMQSKEDESNYRKVYYLEYREELLNYGKLWRLEHID